MALTALKARPARLPKTERQAATARAAELLKEILDYQIRLNRLKVRSSADEDYLISAYKRQIERRQNQLNALPRPLEQAPNPWRTTAT